MSQSKFEVNVEYLYEAPAKPPCRVLVGNMELRNNTDKPVYFIVPFFLDEALDEGVERVECLEVFKTSNRGELYLCVHRNPACYLFPVGPGRTLMLSNWRFMTWSEQVSADVFVVENPMINGLMPVDDWIANAKLPEPPDSEETNILLLSHEPKQETKLSFGKPMEAIHIALAA